MKLIAFCTKGLEQITKQEVKQTISDAKNFEVGDKRIIFESATSFLQLIKLKTVDDLGLYLGKIDLVENIDQLLNFLANLDLLITKKLLKSFRSVNDDFSLTLGMSRTKLGQVEQIKTLLINQINAKYDWTYSQLDHTNFDLRIFIDQQTAYFSIRLTKESLHQRAYKTNSKSGSLRPTVAAAMVLLATKGKSDLKIVDNFSGSGTILCEALFMGHKPFGGDIDPQSLALTQSNLTNLDFKNLDNIKNLDATRTNWPDNFFDCAISNLPWDKQIPIASITNLYEQSIKEFFRIIKKDGTICCLVSKPDLFIKHLKKIKPTAKISSYPIGLLGQNPTIILAVI